MLTTFATITTTTTVSVGGALLLWSLQRLGIRYLTAFVTENWVLTVSNVS